MRSRVKVGTPPDWLSRVGSGSSLWVRAGAGLRVRARANVRPKANVRARVTTRVRASVLPALMKALI